jgi:hypothetical protein
MALWLLLDVKANVTATGLYGCMTSMIPHFLDTCLIDGGEDVNLIHRPPFTPQEHPWYSFLIEVGSTPG